MNILVKVDNIEKALVGVLKADSHQVFVASKFSEALNHYFQNRIDCIIVDLHSDLVDLDTKMVNEARAFLAGNFAGYIWLKYHICAPSQFPQTQKNKTIIICQDSRHADAFKQRFDKKELGGIIVLDPTSSIVKHGSLIEAVKSNIFLIKQRGEKWEKEHIF